MNECVSGELIGPICPAARQSLIPTPRRDFSLQMKYILPLLSLAVPAFAHDATVEMSRAANAFLAALTPEQKAKAAFTFESEAKGARLDWHYIPRDRKGLPLKEMTEPQLAL